MRADRIATVAELQRRSVADLAWYWEAAVVRDPGVRWTAPYTRVLDDSRGVSWPIWFPGGRLNLADNCLDRHVEAGRGATPAVVWEGDDGQSRTLNYAELGGEVNRLANALQRFGGGEGDRVGIFLPMSPEAAIATLAVVKIGAIYTPCFSGFGAGAVASRLSHCEATLLITADGFHRRGHVVRLKETADLNVLRDAEQLGAADDIRLQEGDVIALGGRLEALMEKMGLIGPEVSEPQALNLPLDQAEILVTSRRVEGKALKEFRTAEFAGQLGLSRLERGGVPIPIGSETKLQRFDVLFVTGLKAAVDRAAALLGKVARPSSSTDLLAFGLGMILGFLIGNISIPIAGTPVVLGAGAGLLVSGIVVSSIVSRVRFFGNTPSAARKLLEDLGLVLFIGMVGVNTGPGLVTQLSLSVFVKILLAGFIVTTVPPFVVWIIGYHALKINAAVLMGGVAGARTHSGPALEAAREINSSVPWIGFPVGYAVAGVLLTVFGPLAMMME
jgi:AspT/YidE/YbjL antiporter-like protein